MKGRELQLGYWNSDLKAGQSLEESRWFGVLVIYNTCLMFSRLPSYGVPCHGEGRLRKAGGSVEQGSYMNVRSLEFEGNYREIIKESLLTKDKLHLRARKGLSDATVRAEAKAQGVIGVRGAVHVEDVRIREDFFIVVAGCICRNDALAGFNDLHHLSLQIPREVDGPEDWKAYLAAEDNVLLGYPLHRHGGTSVISAQFLDEGHRERRVGFQILELKGVAEELYHSLVCVSRQPDSIREDGPTSAIMFTMVALPATSVRNAICTASDFSMCPGLSCSTMSLLMRSSLGWAERLSTRLAR